MLYFRYHRHAADAPSHETADCVVPVIVPDVAPAHDRLRYPDCRRQGNRPTATSERKHAMYAPERDTALDIIDFGTSAAINQMGYDEAHDALYIEFHNGNVYRYADVRPSDVADIYEAIARGDSIGRYVNRQVRDRFDYDYVCRAGDRAYHDLFAA